MLKPLQQFICDTCGEIIEEPKHGYVEWEGIVDEISGKSLGINFHIVHHLPHSPLKDNSREGCYRSDELSLSLEDFIGEEGLVQHLSMIDEGPVFYPDKAQPRIADIREWVEIFRRTHIPYYEEARQYFKDAQGDGYFHGLTQQGVCSESNLKTLIKKYS